MNFDLNNLDFGLVEDVCLAACAGHLHVDDLIPTNAGMLGPLLELRHINPTLSADQRWLTSSTYGTLMDRLSTSVSHWFEPSTGRQGFIRAKKLHQDSLAWSDLVIRAKRAAKDAGFEDQIAGKLMAAVGELYSNIIEHSQNVNSGYVVFSAKNGEFEFVVADTGVGVLDSLRTNSKYAKIADAGTALELALSEGISRHSQPDRGHGFRPLFVGLANIAKLVRFRSGDYGREMERMNDGRIQSSTRQIAPILGFFCSVVCSR